MKGIVESRWRLQISVTARLRSRFLLQIPDGPPPPPTLLSVCNPMIPLVLRSAPPVQTASAEHLAGSEAPAGASGARKGTQRLCREYLIQPRIEGARRRIGGGEYDPSHLRVV